MQKTVWRAILNTRVEHKFWEVDELPVYYQLLILSIRWLSCKLVPITANHLFDIILVSSHLSKIVNRLINDDSVNSSQKNGWTVASRKHFVGSVAGL